MSNYRDYIEKELKLSNVPKDNFKTLSSIIWDINDELKDTHLELAKAKVLSAIQLDYYLMLLDLIEDNQALIPELKLPCNTFALKIDLSVSEAQ